MIEKLFLMLQLGKQKLKPLGLFLLYVYIFIFISCCISFVYGLIQFISLCLPMYANTSTSFAQISSFIVLSFFIGKIVWRESLNLVELKEVKNFEDEDEKSNVVYLSSINKKD